MQSAKKKVAVVMPAYNASKTLERTIADIPAGCADWIILTDDGSTDDTVKIARQLGLTVIEHPQNKGYGANQKTCYKAALATEAEYIVMIHPDYQYDSRVIPHALGFIENDICDIILGSRIRTRKETLENGMPLYKYISNRVLTTFENMVLGQNLGDFHSGFRMYNRNVLETIPFEKNSDDFVFDSQFLAQSAYYNFRIGDIPIPTRYFEEASSINFKRSLTYGLLTLAVMSRFMMKKYLSIPCDYLP